MTYWTPGRPTEYRALCAQSASSMLTHFDHHVVEVDGMRGIMLTYHWWELDDAAPRELVVLTNPLPRHLPTSADVRPAVDGHPDAPPYVQTLVDALDALPSETT